MNQVRIIFEEPAWPELEATEKTLHHLADGSVIQISVLDKGMASGRPSVAIRIDFPNGEIVIAETSARLLAGAGKALMARYPRLFED